MYMFITYCAEPTQKFTVVRNEHDLFKWFKMLIFN